MGGSGSGRRPQASPDVIVNAWDADVSLREIAAKYHVSRNTARAVLLRAGRDPGGRDNGTYTRLPDLDPVTLTNLYLGDYLTIREIALRLGCPGHHVGRELRRYGIKKLSRRRSYLSPAWYKLRKRVGENVRTAIKAGLLVRPATCSLCGKSGKIEASHDDYSKPLDVIWLCVSCHRKTDAADPRLIGEIPAPPDNCPRGHLLTDVWIDKLGRTHCKQCRRGQKPQDQGKCSLDGCVATAKIRGMCPRHYNQWLRKNGPIKGSKIETGSE